MRSSGSGEESQPDQPTAHAATTGESFGRPGAQPVWAPGNMHGIGTTAGAASPLRFILTQGVELHYPRVDVSSTGDLQVLILLPGGEVGEERRDTKALALVAARSSPTQGSARTGRGALRSNKRRPSAGRTRST
jgi:hypothetical protein